MDREGENYRQNVFVCLKVVDDPFVDIFSRVDLITYSNEIKFTLRLSSRLLSSILTAQCL